MAKSIIVESSLHGVIVSGTHLEALPVRKANREEAGSEKSKEGGRLLARL